MMTWLLYSRRASPHQTRFIAHLAYIKGEGKMKRCLTAFLTLVLSLSIMAAAQNDNANVGNASSSSSAKSTNSNKKRGPVFRATKDQIKQAQAILKQRGFYGGEESGKLDADTRAGLKKFQEAEGIKVTGTLNRMTLEKMNIALTEKQKAMPA
jgi:peptidoglycan hydrolase-like protein with peptidoglycan-binding domain